MKILEGIEVADAILGALAANGVISEIFPAMKMKPNGTIGLIIEAFKMFGRGLKMLIGAW